MSQTKVTDAVRDVTAVDATKITTGTIPEARITSLDATKLTGDINAARVPAGAVTQHVQATDLTAVHQAIATLGLHTAVSDNKAAFNLPNAFIDTFEDDTGIATETTVDRSSSGEYVSSVSTGVVGVAPTTGDWLGNTGQFTIGSGTVTQNAGDVAVWLDKTWTGDFEISLTTTHSFGNGWTMGLLDVANDSLFTNTVINWWSGNVGWWIKDNANSPYFGQSSEGSGQWATGSVVKWKRVSGVFSVYDDGVLVHTFNSGSQANTNSIRFGLNGGGSATGWALSSISYDDPTVVTENATGTLVSTVQTAPVATTTLSGVILYTDDAGTNTLGSSDELAIYLTANLQGTTPNWTGTNWTEAASYGTPQTFSGTTKQVKLGKTTVTSGTAVAMKAVWANQVATVPAVAGGYATGDQSSSITVTTDLGMANSTIDKLVEGDPVDNNYGAASGCIPTVGGATVGKYIRFDYGSGNSKIIDASRFYQAGTKTTHGVWKWQGSNDASSWTDIGSNFTLGSTSFITAMGDMSSNTTAYRYYQLYGISGTTASAWWSEMEFSEASVAEITGKVAQLNGWAVNY